MIKSRIINKLISFLSLPFTKFLPLLFVIIVLTSAPEIIRQVGLAQWKYCIYVLASNFVVGYLITLIVGCFRGVIQKVLYVFVIVYAYIWMLIGIWTVMLLHTEFVSEMVSILFETNIDESTEFIQTFFTGEYGLAIATVTVLAILTYYVFVKIKNNIKHNVLINTLSLALMLSVVLTVHNPYVYTTTLPYKTSFIFKYQRTPDLRDYLVNPDISSNLDSIPENFVIVFGESHNKSHCSLYNYPIETNPRLKKLMEDNDGKMIVFNDVHSNGTWTIKSFRNMMGEYNSDIDDEEDWYKKLTFIEVLKKAGYYTEWLSNQSNLSFFDNTLIKYSQLCDTSIFTGRGYYDEEMLHKIDERCITDSRLKHKHIFQIIHLLGSHTKYDCTFPENRVKLKPQDYSKYPEHQRKVLADYDNSLIYNDSVVSEIFKRYMQKESVVIYVPDHGEDLFETDSKHFGHGIGGNTESEKIAKNIPFIVFMSDRFVEKFPTKAKSIELSANKYFNTTNLIYTILDIASIRFADKSDNNKISTFSLLSDE